MHKKVNHPPKWVNHRSSKSRSSRWDLQENFEDFCCRVLKYNKKNSWSHFKGVTERKINLFDMPECYSLVHCVAADLKMSKGIAVEFRSLFGRVEELLAQKQSKGGLAFLNIDGRFLYYLITKDYSNGKPTMKALFESLLKLRQHMIANNVTKLAIPRIGCSLDRLDWLKVKLMLEYDIRRTEIKIMVCSL